MDTLNINSLLLKFISNNKLSFFFYLLFTMFEYPLIYIYIPEYYGKVINSFKDKSQSSFVYFIKILTLLYILSWICDGIVMLAMYFILPKFTEYATGHIFEFIIDHYENDFDNIHMGEIISKIIKIPSILFEYIDVIKNEIIKYIFVFVGGFIHYYSVSNTSLLLYSLFVVLNYVFMYVLYKYFHKLDLKANQYQDGLYDVIVDCLNNMASIYTCNQESYEKDRFYTSSFANYKDIMYKIRELYMAGNIIWGIFVILVFISLNYVLYKTYLRKDITAEKLISSFIITFSIIRIFEKTERCANNISSINSKILDTETFFNSLDPIHKNNKQVKNTFKNGDIIISNVYHKYDKDFVLDNINIQIQKGEKIAFVGQIGSGKTTMIKILVGFQPLLMGNITIAGVSINNISNEDIRKHIFYIPQKPKLFNRTLYENIVYGLKKPPSKTEILTILDDLKLDDIKKVFEPKMDELMGIEGNKLSGGQRQIVWLLRSFFRNNHIIIMDEPTASLDPENKERIVHIIKKLSIGKTVIIVTHDNIDDSFRKIEFKAGKLISSSYF
jgi:ABC-type multidrug transport system fused ATPase/permease subunit